MPLPKNVGGAIERAIDELIGKHEVERPQFFAQAADRARRDDRLDAQHLEAVDVGAEVQLRRHQPMPVVVSRQKRDALAAQRRQRVRPGRIAKRRRQHVLLAIGELRHVVQAAAANDSNLCSHVVSVSS